MYKKLTAFANAFGVLSIQAINQPFSVSSTRAIPLRPRCFTNSVKVTQRVEFMWRCCLSAMYSWYTRFAATRLVPNLYLVDKQTMRYKRYRSIRTFLTAKKQTWTGTVPRSWQCGFQRVLQPPASASDAIPTERDTWNHSHLDIASRKLDSTTAAVAGLWISSYLRHTWEFQLWIWSTRFWNTCSIKYPTFSSRHIYNNAECTATAKDKARWSVAMRACLLSPHEANTNHMTICHLRDWYDSQERKDFQFWTFRDSAQPSELEINSHKIIDRSDAKPTITQSFHDHFKSHNLAFRRSSGENLGLGRRSYLMHPWTMPCRLLWSWSTWVLIPLSRPRCFDFWEDVISTSTACKSPFIFPSPLYCWRSQHRESPFSHRDYIVRTWSFTHHMKSIHKSIYIFQCCTAIETPSPAWRTIKEIKSRWLGSFR